MTTLLEILRSMPYDMEESAWNRFEQILDLWAPAITTDDGIESRNFPSVAEYDEIVKALCMALVFWGGLDVIDLMKRLVDEWRDCTPENTTFPYVYQFSGKA